MVEPAKRERAPWSPGRRVAALILAGLCAAALAYLLLAPSVDSTCARVLELARLAGEPTDAADHDICVAHYERARRRGLVRWAVRSWCIRFADTIPEAGGC